MGNVRGFDSYGQDMFYQTKGGFWMPKEIDIKPKTKALVPVGKRQPLPVQGQIVPIGGGAAQGNTAPKAQKPAAETTAPKAKPASSQSMVGTIEKQGDKFVAEVNGKKRAFSSEKMAQKYIDHELRKAAPLGDVTKQNAPQAEAPTAQAEKAENKKAAPKGKTRLSNAVIDEKVDAYRKAMEKQGLKGEKLEQQVARYREGLLAERQKHFNKVKGKVKGRNIAKERAQGKLKVKPKNNGMFAKIGKFFKGKGGKVAAIAAGVAALGAGLYALLGGKDKKVEETPTEVTPIEEAPTEETDPVAVVPPTDADTTEPAPAEETPVEETPTEETPAEPAYQPIVTLNEDGSYTTQKNDNFFKLAENLLKDYCKANGLDKEITGFSPEVKQLAEKIMTDNNYWYDFSYTNDRKRPSAPMLHPNVTLKLPEIKDFIEKKVDLAA